MVNMLPDACAPTPAHLRFSLVCLLRSIHVGTPHTCKSVVFKFWLSKIFPPYHESGRSRIFQSVRRQNVLPFFFFRAYLMSASWENRRWFAGWLRLWIQIPFVSVSCFLSMSSQISTGSLVRQSPLIYSSLPSHRVPCAACTRPRLSETPLLSCFSWHGRSPPSTPPSTPPCCAFLPTPGMWVWVGFVKIRPRGHSWDKAGQRSVVCIAHRLLLLALPLALCAPSLARCTLFLSFCAILASALTSKQWNAWWVPLSESSSPLLFPLPVGPNWPPRHVLQHDALLLLIPPLPLCPVPRRNSVCFTWCITMHAAWHCVGCQWTAPFCTYVVETPSGMEAAFSFSFTHLSGYG